MAANPDHFIQHAIQNPGGLHRALGVPEGEPIPPAQIEQATHSPDAHLKKMAVLARTLAKVRGGQ